MKINCIDIFNNYCLEIKNNFLMRNVDVSIINKYRKNKPAVFFYFLCLKAWRML